MTSLADLATQFAGEISGASTAINNAIEKITADSQAVNNGTVFVAVPGATVHGAKYAQQAIESGAAAIITDGQGAALIAAVSGGDAKHEANVPVLVIERVAERVGELAAAVYGAPAKQLRTYGITGTNGKTTTSYMLESLLKKAGRNAGLIGGVELRIAGESRETDITTPVPADIQRMLATHLASGGTDVVMEVTSHALLQNRTAPIKFTVAGFTHLSIDHLDYHQNIEEYFAAKSKLFTAERAEAAVVLIDDEWGKRIYAQALAELPTVFALAMTADLPVDAQGWKVEKGSLAGEFALIGTDGLRSEHVSGLPGDYNIANAALAVAMAKVAGIQQVAREVDPDVPGRMEVISAAEPRVIVDFAHNADALEKMLIALRPTTAGRLIVVTGTAGDRDATKRFAMGEACAKYADIVVITDDDPHTEDPQQIRNALIAGTVDYQATVIEVADRTAAVERAVLLAADADTVVIAGRGHWTVQFVGHDLIELDDREIARAALAKRARDEQR